MSHLSGQILALLCVFDQVTKPLCAFISLSKERIGILVSVNTLDHCLAYSRHEARAAACVVDLTSSWVHLQEAVLLPPGDPH